MRLPGWSYPADVLAEVESDHGPTICDFCSAIVRPGTATEVDDRVVCPTCADLLSGNGSAVKVERFAPGFKDPGPGSVYDWSADAERDEP